jgi:hypothetical protein
MEDTSWRESLWRQGRLGLGYHKSDTAKYGRIRRVPQQCGWLAILGRVRQCDAGGDGVTAGQVEDGRCVRRSTKRRTEIVMKNKNNADELFSGRNYPFQVRQGPEPRREAIRHVPCRGGGG